MESAEVSKTAESRKLQEDSDRGDNILDCPVCMTAYDGTVRRPRTLPCGHTFCTPCIDGLKDQDKVMCPTCRVDHAVPESGWFPVTYVIESLMQRIREMEVVTPTPMPDRNMEEPTLPLATGPSQKRTEGLSRPIQSMVKEQEDKVLAAICSSQEVQEQLDHYQTTLKAWGDQHQKLDDKLQALVEQNNHAMLLVRQEEAQVVAQMQQVQQGKQQLHAVLQTLRTATTREEAVEATEDAEHLVDEERQRTAQCLGVFPDSNTVTTVRKAVAASTAAVKAAETIECAAADVAGDDSLPADPSSTLAEKLQSLMVLPLKAEDLRTLTQPARSLLQAGLVFTAHKTEGQTRHAKIRLDGNRQYLHSLQDQTVPPGAAILQMDEVVPPAPPCQVFLDLVWPGSAPHRVVIRLSPNTSMGEQFVLLCTGQRGPCYRNTQLLDLLNKGQPGEWIVGGDYENNDGTGGTALLPHFDMSKYQDLAKAGAVIRAFPTSGIVSKWNTWFGITTRACENGPIPAFGDVVEGLEGLRAAAQHSPITEVTVVECGVVLWT